MTPLSESALRRLLLFLHERGDTDGALREYELFARLLLGETEEEPSPETRRLVAELGNEGRRARSEALAPAGAPSAPAAVDSSPAPSPSQSPRSPVATEPALGPDAPRRRRRVRRLRVLLGAGSLAAALYLPLALGPPRAARPGASIPGTAVRLTDATGADFNPAISPDGESIVYTRRLPTGQHLFLRPTAGGDEISLTLDLEGDHHSPSWSPDGKQIAFVTEVRGRSRLQIVVPIGGIVRSVYESDAFLILRSPAWEPDGNRLAFATGNAIFTLDLAGGGLVKLAESRHPHSLSWSPDGRWLAFGEENLGVSGIRSVYLGNIAPSSLRLLALEGGEVHVLIDDGALNSSPMWSADGRHLLYTSDRDGTADVFRIALTSDGRPAGPVERITTGANVLGATLSRDGRRLAYGSFRQRSNIWSVPIPATGQGPVLVSDGKRVTSGDQVIETLGVSRDGRWLAYDSGLHGNQDLFVVPTAGGDPVRLTLSPGHDFGPSFSPDHRSVVFYSYREGGRSLFVADAQGGGVIRLTEPDAFDAFPNWSPDGLRIVFQRRDWASDVPYLYVTKRDDERSSWGSPQRMWSRYGQLPRWSPDGSRLLFATDQDVRVMPAGGGAARIIHPRPGFPIWSADGELVYVKESLGPVGTSGDRFGIWEVSLDGRHPQLIVTDPESHSPHRAFGTDGEHFFYTMSERESDIWVTELAPGG